MQDDVSSYNFELMQGMMGYLRDVRAVRTMRGFRTSNLRNSEGVKFMRDCDCRAQRRAERRLAGTKITRRYEHCTLDNFESAFSGATRSVTGAHLRAKDFVEKYPLETGGFGLLLTGSIGVGKTHLATGILRKLVSERGQPASSVITAICSSRSRTVITVRSTQRSLLSLGLFSKLKL